MRLAIITTHPIQYYAPVFKLLHEKQQAEIKVFYSWGQNAVNKFDHGFNKPVNWDLDLLDGYPFEWMENTAVDPGSHHFNGIINPNAIEQIREWKPDALLVYGWAYKGHLKIMRHFKNKIPIYFRGDSTLLVEPKGVKKLLKYIFLNWVYKHVDHAFYVGENNKAYYKKYGLKEGQLSFAPHAIDNARFRTDRSVEAAELRSSLNLKEDDILILFAGKFEQVKNVGLLLSAFIDLNKPGVHLLLVGNGINEESLKKQAEESIVADRIHFIPFRNQTYMPVLYQAADLFCLPSNSETWGLAINEAMACGKAVLVSDKVGAAADLVKPGYNGAIFKAGSLTDLIYNLNQLLADGKNGLVNMGKHSKNVIKNWNFENQVATIGSIIAHG
jgi:glycosyltransferase involved in cell wall biosynthesis